MAVTLYSSLRNEVQFLNNIPFAGSTSKEVNVAKIGSIMVDKTSVNTLYAGTAVKLTSSGTNRITVDKAAANDPIFGFVTYSPIYSSYTAGMTLEIQQGGYMYLVGDDAIVAGDQVEFYPSPVLGGNFDAVKSYVSGDGNTIVGRAVRSTDSNGLVEVFVASPLVSA